MTSDNQTYTLNKLQMYDECPQKYKLCYIDKAHVIEPITKTKTGNRLHSLINYYLKGMDVAKLIETLNQSEKLLWHNFKNSDVSHYNCYASEYSFNVKIDEYWLTGRIDALFEANSNYVIADWKTGNDFSPEIVKFQTSFYLLCMYEILRSKNLIKEPQQLSLYYMVLAANNIIKINFDEDLYNQYKSLVLSVIHKINENKTFFCNKSDKCKYCKYYRVCPYY